MVDERFDAINEMQGMRHANVGVERGFVNPAGVNEEELRIAGGTVSVVLQTACFCLRSLGFFTERLRERVLLSFARVEASKDE